ncbi:MAG TPA: GNAT family N-acetyltransferase [Candidatus Polarisedimenticolaceae bacterium]|nr:GNAT family N-acetyltransferase [Candidatus Polarisedimenticolaceae bacterium]
MASLIQASTPEHWSSARRLIEAYAASLDVDLCFQGFDEELRELSTRYGPPEGALLLAPGESAYVGCVALHRWSADSCEMKRLYVAPEGRGHGLGRTLTEAVIAEARRIGYARMLLDTLPSMREAQGLYRSLGFVPVTAYRPNPVPGSLFLELAL